MASIRSVEGRSGALQASNMAKAAKTRLMVQRNAGRDLAQAVPKTATQAAQTSTAHSREAVSAGVTTPKVDYVARNAGRDLAQAVPKTAAQGAQRNAVTISSPTSNTSSGGTVSSPVYKAPTPTSSTSTSSTESSTKAGDNVATAPPPAPTSSGGTSKAVGQPNLSNAGKGRGLGRGNRKSKRSDPRASRSTSIDELKKQAARQLGM